MRAIFLILVSSLALNSNAQGSINLTSNGVTISYTLPEFKKFCDSVSQISVDTLQNRFIRCLNLYRASKSLPLVVFDVNAYNASKFITEYNLESVNGKKLTHTTNINGYQELKDRRVKFNIDTKYTKSILCENLATSSDFFAFFFFKSQKLTYEQFLLKIWKESPGHNANLIRPDSRYIGFNIIFKTKSEYLRKCVMSSVMY